MFPRREVDADDNPLKERINKIAETKYKSSVILRKFHRVEETKYQIMQYFNSENFKCQK
jgi:UDP-glucose 4-epimerase